MEKTVQPKVKVNILAKISLLCAIFVPVTLYLLGIIIPFLILAVPLSLLLAIILGSIACYKISKNKEHLRGKNWAISGIIIGGLLLFVIISISAPKFWKASRITVKSEAVAEIDFFIKALEAYYKDYKHYPSTIEGLKSLETTVDPNNPYSKWGASYISLRGKKKGPTGVLLDPWAHEYQYTSDGKSFTIISYGADGKPGGTGFNADITSEQVKRGEKLW